MNPRRREHQFLSHPKAALRAPPLPLALYAHIEERREPLPWPPGYCMESGMGSAKLPQHQRAGKSRQFLRLA